VWLRPTPTTNPARMVQTRSSDRSTKNYGRGGPRVSLLSHEPIVPFIDGGVLRFHNSAEFPAVARHRHHRGTQQSILELVPLLQFLEHELVFHLIGKGIREK
jgi:hypothetical protein